MSRDALEEGKAGCELMVRFSGEEQAVGHCQPLNPYRARWSGQRVSTEVVRALLSQVLLY